MWVHLFFGMIYAINKGMENKINNKKNDWLKIRIEPTLLERLKTFCKRLDVKYSNVVREAIKSYLDMKERKQ